jgi:predicted RNA-binding Zn-ribbon protein involved in translation (DUF1610 family)
MSEYEAFAYESEQEDKEYCNQCGVEIDMIDVANGGNCPSCEEFE